MHRALALLVAATACTPEVTYWRDVSPIVEAHCAGCHKDGSVSRLNLLDPVQAAAKANDIAGAVEKRIMPPWMPAANIAYDHERRLTDAEIATFTKWAELGAPEGSESSKPGPVASDIPVLDVSHEVKMESPYQPSTVRSDDYRCFVLNPKMDKRTAITGFDIRPGDRRIVHHVILYSVAPSKKDKAIELDTKEAGEGYNCYGGPGIPFDDEGGLKLLGGWAPGTPPTQYPYGTGIVVPAGSLVVMEVHYNTLEIREATDQTTALLSTADPANVKEAYLFPIGVFDFEIPPGVEKTVSDTWDSSDFPLPDGVKVWGSLPHMHTRGKSLSVKLQRLDGTIIPVMDVPKWNFDWQQLYFYKEPILLNHGDKVSIDCRFDNRKESQPKVNGVQVEPPTLTWGESTLQEMCLNFFYATL